VTLIYGTHDAVITPAQVISARSKLPAQTRLVAIEGWQSLAARKAIFEGSVPALVTFTSGNAEACFYTKTIVLLYLENLEGGTHRRKRDRKTGLELLLGTKNEERNFAAMDTPPASVTRIQAGTPEIAIINLFDAHDEQGQQHLLELLTQVTDRVMKHQPGFISANLHISHPSPIAASHYVANYAQWSSLEAIRAMLSNPEAKEHMDQIEHHSRYRRIGAPFSVVSVFHPEPSLPGTRHP
jgi:hypothetical protein